MPMLRIRGIKEEHIKQVSTKMVDDLSQIVGCPRDYFTLECVSSQYIFDGACVPQQPIVEILWFPREQEVQDAVARCITTYLQGELESLEVFFITLKATQYYENGVHY